MRVTSGLWVSALLRRVQSTGDFGAVLRRGSEEAGAVFVICRSRFGEVTLYGPAPQIAYEEGKPQERQFSKLAGAGDDEAVQARLEREIRFDSDLWAIEIETNRPADEFFPVRTP